MTPLRRNLAAIFLVAVLLPATAPCEESPSNAPLNADTLIGACKAGDLDLITRCLDAGVDIQAVDSKGQWTPLIATVSTRQSAAMKLLLKRGAHPNLDPPEEWIRPALFWATRLEDMEILVAHGAKTRDGIGAALPQLALLPKEDFPRAVELLGPFRKSDLQVALITAAHGGREHFAELLISLGADPDGKSDWAPGVPAWPLHTCAIFGTTEVAKVLLKHGADPNFGEGKGLPLAVAIFNMHAELVRVLRNVGAKGASDLAVSIALQEEDAIAKLLTSAPTWSDNPDFWKMVVTAAGIHGRIDVARVALSGGVPLFAADPDKAEDALVAASGEGNWEVVEFLLRQEQIPIPPISLERALWNAAWNSQPYENQRPAEDFLKTASLLVNAGANANGKDGQNFPTLGAAVFTRNPGGSPDMIRILLQNGADPNPEISKGVRLNSMVKTTCETQTCSTPEDAVVTALLEGGMPPAKDEHSP